jgi:effector-binding domain-containing protein
MADIQLTQCDERPTAGIREQVPIEDLTGFFARAFGDTMAFLQARGLAPVGPPFGKYYGAPGEIMDVEAGFPVANQVTPAGKVVSGILPGGRVVEAVHVWSYETTHRTYADMERYFTDAGLRPGSIMWESYLNDPATEPDPAAWRTRICWPVLET